MSRQQGGPGEASQLHRQVTFAFIALIWTVGGRVTMANVSCREVTQERTGFSPNDRVFGHNVFGPLTVSQADWKKLPPPTNLTDYIHGLKRRLFEAGKMA